jgi:hypothetical protein
MPATPTTAQSDASRRNGARSSGPATDTGKARSALNGVRHGLCGRTFFLLADEDPAEFHRHEALWLAAWSPRDLHEHQAAEAAIRATWREARADRLEAQALGDLFAADRIADEAEREAAKAAALRALGALLRYRGRIQREHDRAMHALTTLRQRRLIRSPAAPPSENEPRRTEPEPGAVASAPMAPAPAAAPLLATVPGPAALPAAASPPWPTPVGPSEPERALNRHQRRALAAMARRAA